ncbi:aspartic peptidase domain-containing protein [Schizophyllum amplum]|uniref:Aspartic peptidase domain-containing protein n=1 Tax=Schizophyllum amplum TaxID=97359 RepID=A0A550CJ91_9AGAR|nr:aspartic peptidase domain-containing protein [Auriculariopsis ampla]
MYFTSSLALLAGALFAVDAAAAPSVANDRRSAGMVHMGLRQVPASNEHALIRMQQHINRGNRRLARMTGREGPSDEEMRTALQRRVDSIPTDMLARRYSPEDLERRFNRNGWKREDDKREYTYTVIGKRDAANRPHPAVELRGLDPEEPERRFPPQSIEARKNRVGYAGRKPARELEGRRHRHHPGNNNKDNDGGNGAAATDCAAATATGTASGSAASASASGDAASADGVTAANTPATANTLGLDIEGNDVGYLSTVQMGTPPQDFEILMDSGSADLWVGSTQCTSVTGADCGPHTFLGSDTSSSFQASNTPFQVTYGTGAVAGAIIQDNIAMGGLNLDAHTFGVATQETEDFADDSVPFDGLMGLAQSTLSNQGVPTPPEALADAGLIDDAIVSYKIPRLADGLNDGQVTFGGLDDTKFDATTLTTVDNVSPDGFWEADLDGAAMDGTDLGFTGRTAILDTGTTLMIVPDEDATTIHQNIDGAALDQTNGFLVPCDTAQTLSLTFGGTSFDIDSRDLAFADLGDGSGMCVSGIQAGNVGGANEWLVGDTFLKNAYFSTDVGNNQLSLAKLV